MVNFVPQQIFPLGNDSYNQLGCFGEEKNLLLLPGFEPWTVQPIVYFLIAHCLTAIQTTLLQLVIYSILSPVRLLATPVTAVCKYCCSVSDVFHVIIPNIFFLTTRVNLHFLLSLFRRVHKMMKSDY
jgi:hypothetical protein